MNINKTSVGGDATTWKIYKEKFDVSSKRPDEELKGSNSLETVEFLLVNLSGSCIPISTEI